MNRRAEAYVVSTLSESGKRNEAYETFEQPVAC